MKVLHVIPSISRGGIERMLLAQYSEVCAESGSGIFTLSPALSNQKDEFEASGFRIYYPAGKDRRSIISAFMRRVPIETFDVIHVHLTEVSWTVLLLLKLRQFKGMKIVHSHNFYAEKVRLSATFKRFLTRLSVRMVRAEKVACSVEAGEWLFGKNQDFYLLKNSFDIDQFAFQNDVREDTRASLGVASNEQLMIFVGRFEPQKDPLQALNFFASNKHWECGKLLMLGDGSLLGEIKAAISKRELNDAVILLGNVSDVTKYLFAADCFVAPSRHEGLGIAAVEAYLTGMPLFISKAFPREVCRFESTFVLNELRTSQIGVNAMKCEADDRFKTSVQRLEHVRSLGYDVKGLQLHKLYDRVKAQ